ncbi:pilus assembly protein [Ectopseudomonas mendocina]
MHTVKIAGKTFGSMLVFAFYFSGFNSAVAATLNISQKPLMLSETVAPNLVFTLDDSGSMRWAFAPDDAGREASASNLRNTRRGMSSSTNPMYYNPNVEYRLPVKLNTDGSTPATGYTTEFDKAWQNGFQTSYGSINLSNNYRVSWNFSTDEAVNYNYNSSVNYAAPTGQIFNLSQNPALDFGGSENVTLVAGSPVTRNILGRTVTFTRSGNSCSISPTISGVTCTRNSGNSFSITKNLTQTGVPAYYYVYDPSLAGCNANKNNDACHRPVFVSANSGPGGTDERENFAIWYSFYRTRALATVSAANLAFNEMASSTRLTWQTLAVCSTLNTSSTDCGTSYFRDFSPRHKANFLNWLANVKFNSSTPLLAATKRAGEFYTTATPWAHTPNPMTSNGGRGTTVTSPEYACRPSFHVLMTDGMWNDASFPSGITRHDGASFKPGATSDTSYSYNGTRAPFGNDEKTTTGTLADIAMHYWATDLRSGLENDLKPYIHTKNSDAEKQFWDPRNNPATWQHMVNYTMGLGLTNSLNATNLPWTGETFGGAGYARLAAGTANWPAASASNANNVYDLWHAAVNSRGEFFSVDSPDDMVKAFKAILNRIADRTTTAARPAVSAAFVSDNINQLQSRVYATQFSSEDWSGEITKTTINKMGMVVPGEGWSTRTANANLDPTQRKVMIKDSGNKSTGLQSFTWSNLTPAQQAALNINPESLGAASDNRGQDRLNYIRGERSKEGIASPDFRQRSTILGDIINSSPALVGTPAYLPHLADSIERRDRGDGYKNYGEFRLANNRSQRKEMLYVGSNGGMLHGFESDTGRETFAFVPSAVIGNLNKLTGQNYVGGEHHYFVDGSPVVRDVYFDNTDGWRTVLVGTLRAGGKALFALDVTDPDNIKLLWEFDSSNDEDLGYTFAQPEIVRLHSGQWAVLQGNGYNSTNDKAALLVIDIKTGELLKKVVVPDAIDDDNITLSNGLSSVRAADNNGDGLADYAYAGDLQGNVWRFDLTPSTTAEFGPNDDPFYRGQNELEKFTAAGITLAYGEEPLFVARDKTGKRQAITIQPSLVRHPSNLGYLVLVGTGKYFENSDANVDKSRAMSVYGIWDRKTRRQETKFDEYARVNRIRANLQKQEFITQEESVEFGEDGKEVTNDIRLLSQNIVQWYKDPDVLGGPIKPNEDEHVEKWGWRLDLAIEEADEETWDDSLERDGKQTLAGEMVVNNMAARGNTLLLSTLTPNDDPCQAGATTWFYGVSAHTGGRTPKNILDLNNDRAFNGLDQFNDRVVSGRRFNAPGGFTLSPGGVFGEGGQPPMTLPDVVGPPRQSWHIIPEDFQ